MNDAKVDFLLLPTVESPPPLISAKDTPDEFTDYCDLSAWSGLPAAAVPAGRFGSSDFPYSLMLIGRYGSDPKLLVDARRVMIATN